jgi:hypothetical protein
MPATGLAFRLGAELDAGFCRDVVGFEESAELVALFIAAIPARDCAACLGGVLAWVDVIHVCESGIR